MSTNVAAMVPEDAGSKHDSPWLTPAQVADRLGVSVNKVYEYPRMEHPLPVYYPPGNGKGWRAYAPELDRWVLQTWRKKM